MEAKREFKGVWIKKEIWLSKDLNITEKLFMAEIDSYSDGKQGCFASNKHFAKFSGLSASRCSSIIGDLEKKGFITIKLQRAKGSNRVVRRYITINQNGTSETEGGTSETEGGTSETKRGYFGNSEGTNTSTTNTITNTITNVHLDLFEEFWEEYPRKINKKKSKQKYLKIINEELHKQIMSDLKSRKSSNEWKDIKYIPHPTTYLNGERWNDEIAETKYTDIYDIPIL